MRFFYPGKSLTCPDPRAKTVFTAVNEYMKSIEMGNYAPKPRETNWDSAEELKFIEQLLNNCSISFGDITLPETRKSNVPHIAHLLASLAIFKECIELPPTEQLKKLQEMRVWSQIKAGMPGPAMIYIHILSSAPKSDYDDISKLMMLTEIINALENHDDKFGALNSVVRFFALYQQALLIKTLEPVQAQLFSHEEQSVEELTQASELTFIDRCILQICKRFGINIELENVGNSELNTCLSKNNTGY